MTSAAPMTEDLIPDTDLIVVDMFHPDRNPWREAFIGRWITLGYVDATFTTTRMVWRVAITRTGALVAYRTLATKDSDGRDVAKDHLDQWTQARALESVLRRFGTYDDFAATVPGLGYPESVLPSVRAAYDRAVIRHHFGW